MITKQNEKNTNIFSFYAKGKVNNAWIIFDDIKSAGEPAVGWFIMADIILSYLFCSLRLKVITTSYMIYQQTETGPTSLTKKYKVKVLFIFPIY